MSTSRTAVRASIVLAHHARSARLHARLSVELYYSDRARARELSALAVEEAGRAEDDAALAAALNAHRVALWSPSYAGCGTPPTRLRARIVR